MNAPVKAKKNARNQPVKFEETLAAGLPVVRPGVGTPLLTLPRIRFVLGLVWLFAALTAGIGIGRLIIEARPGVVSETPTPIAATTLKVISAAAAITPVIAAPTTPVVSNVSVLPSTAFEQAQAGTTYATLAAVTYQSALGNDALQPGFSAYLRAQGTLGTVPVR